MNARSFRTFLGLMALAFLFACNGAGLDQNDGHSGDGDAYWGDADDPDLEESCRSLSSNYYLEFTPYFCDDDLCEECHDGDYDCPPCDGCWPEYEGVLMDTTYSHVYFIDIPPGDEALRTRSIANGAWEPVYLEYEIVGDEGFAMPSFPTTLDAKSKIEFEISFSPTEARYYRAELHIEARDVNNPERVQHFQLELHGNQAMPVVTDEEHPRVWVERLHFRPVDVGDTYMRKLVVRNCSEISSVEIDPLFDGHDLESFSMEDPEHFPFRLGPRRSTVVGVEMTRLHEDQANASLALWEYQHLAGFSFSRRSIRLLAPSREYLTRDQEPPSEFDGDGDGG